LLISPGLGALLLSRDLELALVPSPDGSVQASSAAETTAAPGPATQTWCSRLRQSLLGVAVCCFLRRREFRLSDTVEAVRGGPLDVDVLADHVGGDAGVAQRNASENGNGSVRSAGSRSPSSLAISAACVRGGGGAESEGHYCNPCRRQANPVQGRVGHSVRAVGRGSSAASSSRLVVPVFNMAL
jgi:hypothetical protein